MLYRALYDNVLVRFDAEDAHRWAFEAIRAFGRVPVVRDVVRDVVAPASRVPRPEVFGRRLRGSFGLAAGFDKDARAVVGLTSLGFAFVEIGSVTAIGQPGNEKPRLWRELELHGIRNRMGFNNDGAEVVARRLRALRRTGPGRRAVIGVNIGRSKVTPADRAAEDYATSAGLLAPLADYLVVNVSSPNTPGLRDLQAVESLRPILEAVRTASDEAVAGTRRERVPLLVKIAPDLADGDIDEIADLVLELGLDGMVAVNTTVGHDLGPGGLSGPPELPRGLEVVARLRRRLGPEPVIIGVGGISSARDAQAYVDAGATLTQGYTGFIYEGAFWPGRVNRGLRSRGAAPGTAA